jgi:hypothetical protein
MWNIRFEYSETRITEIQILHVADSLLYYKHILRDIFSGVKQSKHGIDHQPNLAPRLKNNRVIPLHHIRAFTTCFRVKFTFFSYKVLKEVIWPFTA